MCVKLLVHTSLVTQLCNVVVLVLNRRCSSVSGDWLCYWRCGFSEHRYWWLLTVWKGKWNWLVVNVTEPCYYSELCKYFHQLPTSAPTCSVFSVEVYYPESSWHIRKAWRELEYCTITFAFYYIRTTMFGDRSWALHGSWQKFLQRLDYTLIIFFRQLKEWHT